MIKNQYDVPPTPSLMDEEKRYHFGWKPLRYQSQELLVVNEIGYFSLGGEGSNLFLQIINARHAKKFTVITTNLPFADWSNIFDETAATTTIADRLIDNSEILLLEGQSYRIKA